MITDDSCKTGKRRYKTQVYADFVADQIENKTFEKQRSYLCPFCYGYHLTSQEKDPA